MTFQQCRPGLVAPLPDETYQGFPIALRKKARFFTLLFEALLVCPLPPWLAPRKFPQASAAVPAPDIRTLLPEWAGLPPATGPLHMLCSLPGAPSTLTYLHNTGTCLLTLTIAFQESLPRACFLSEHFSRIVIVSSSLYYLINVCFPLGCKSTRARACLLSITMVSPVHSVVSGTQ